MDTEKLFDITNDAIEGPAKHNADPYSYYQKSYRQEIRSIRELLERWFYDYPILEKKELKARFKKDFDSAFYELFLFQLFLSEGFKIEIHPKLNDRLKRPDFLIHKKGFKAYVEAKICYDKTDKEMAFERKKNQFLDELNKLKIRGFYLQVSELKFKIEEQPSTKKLIKKIEIEILEIDREELIKRLNTMGRDSIPNIYYEDDNFSIKINPIPVSDEFKNKIIERPIGIITGAFDWGGGEDSLKNSITKKANRYGKFNLPYLICINSLGIKTYGDDINNVIWGLDESEGFFCEKNRIKYSNVSGVLVTKVSPAGISNSNYWLYKNPFARHNFNYDTLNLKLNYVEKGKVKLNEGNDLDKVFNLSKKWPFE